MIPHFTNNVYTSVLLWADNRLSNQQQAYINKTTKLSYQADPAMAAIGKVAYASPYRQWVCDSGVNGAFIANGISGSNISLERGQSGMSVDYDGGRVLLNSSVGSGLNITGSYAIKEINFYMANESQEQLLTTDKYVINPRYSQPTGVIPPYSMVTPAVFVSVLKSDNQPLAFGGLKMSKQHMSFTVFTEAPYQLDAVLGCFADAKETYIPLLSINDWPLNAYGDVKSGYDYSKLAQNRGTPGNLAFIREVYTSKVSDAAKINQMLYAGIIDLEVDFPRATKGLFGGV